VKKAQCEVFREGLSPAQLKQTTTVTTFNLLPNVGGDGINICFKRDVKDVPNFVFSNISSGGESSTKLLDLPLQDENPKELLILNQGASSTLS